MKDIGLFLVLLLILVGCDDFLEESSQDEVRPSTVEDLVQLMAGEAYPFSRLTLSYNDMLTDDMQCNGAQGQDILVAGIEEWYPVFTWQDNMYEELESEDVNTWQTFYHKIMGCNTVLGYLDRVVGDQKTKDNLHGQALCLRAWYYFMLVNYYGLPYNYGDPATNLGVPLKLEMDVTDAFYKRNTVAEVYESVIADLKSGIDYLEKNKMETSYYKVSDLMGKALLSRVYLYMEQWDSVLVYANKVLEEKSTLTSLASAPAGAFSQVGNDTWGMYNSSTSQEIIWMYGSLNEFNYIATGGLDYISPWTVSEDLLGEYETSTDQNNYLDLRYRMYFQWKNLIDFTTFQIVYYAPYGFKGYRNGQGGATKGIRVAEVYLNRAEAYIHKFMESGDDNYRVAALEDLNELRRNRYDTRNVAYNPVNLQTAEELYTFYKSERRRELCFEDHRWFDLRRYGMEPLTHVYFTEENNQQEFTLEKNDLRFVLPIPQEALDRNPDLIQNER